MKQPSKETRVLMLKFFLKHSVPRILAAEREEKRKEELKKQRVPK